MNYLDKVYTKSDSIVFRKIADEFILVPIRQNVGDLESIYTLNETAARIWELIDGKIKVKEIKENLARIDEFALNNTVFVCDTETSKKYGDIKTLLRKKANQFRRMISGLLRLLSNMTLHWSQKTFISMPLII